MLFSFPFLLLAADHHLSRHILVLRCPRALPKKTITGWLYGLAWLVSRGGYRLFSKAFRSSGESSESSKRIKSLFTFTPFYDHVRNKRLSSVERIGHRFRWYVAGRPVPGEVGRNEIFKLNHHLYPPGRTDLIRNIKLRVVCSVRVFTPQCMCIG